MRERPVHAHAQRAVATRLRPNAHLRSEPSRSAGETRAGSQHRTATLRRHGRTWRVARRGAHGTARRESLRASARVIASRHDPGAGTGDRGRYVMRRVLFVAAALAGILLLPSAVHAQATIAGVIRDASAAVLP